MSARAEIGERFAVGSRRRYARHLKRIVDICVAIFLLVFAAPLMFLVALAIRCDSPGPTIYRQERVGANGRQFVLLKFRSMIQDAEREGRPVWAAERDPRVTRIGRFIRYTRIDELPQLVNVLCGDMSMVGPRPERPYFVEQLSEIIPAYPQRHAVKPGITGWAQVNFRYGASVEDARRKLEYDLFYVRGLSWKLDLQILLLTFGVVIFGRGAR